MTWFEINNSGHKLIEFQAWCWLSFYWVLHKGVDQIYRLGSSFQKGYSTQHKLLQGSISRIWNGWTPDKIYPISWKQWKRRKREGNLWKSEKRSVVMEIRWAEWPRRKVCRAMKNLGYCWLYIYWRLCNRKSVRLSLSDVKIAQINQILMYSSC